MFILNLKHKKIVKQYESDLKDLRDQLFKQNKEIRKLKDELRGLNGKVVREHTPPPNKIVPSTTRIDRDTVINNSVPDYSPIYNDSYVASSYSREDSCTSSYSFNSDTSSSCSDSSSSYSD